MRKIILFLESPFNQRDYKRFGVEILQRNGFEVEVWDLSSVFYPKLHLVPPDSFQFPGLKIFNNRHEVMNACERLSSQDMIITWFVYPRFFWLYKTISRNKAAYSALFLASVPPYFDTTKSSPLKKSILDRMFDIGIEHRWQFRKIISRIINKIISIVPYKYLGIKPITFWFAATAYTVDNYLFPCDQATKKVFLHVYDYDLYIENMDEISIKNENHAVFLDVYMPFHEDNKIWGNPYAIKAGTYYPKLSNFFDYVEKERNVKVVIAAHPRSHYEVHPDYFNKRTLQRGRTIELVRDAKFIITHDSASFNFAIMYFKPMIFIITDEMVRQNMTSMVYNMASWFGKEPINIDRPLHIDWENELKVDKENYDRYFNTFIKKKGTDNIYSWQIVANKLKEF